MINTNGEEPQVNNSLFDGFTKDERINFLGINTAMQYYKPMVQGKDYPDFDKILKRAKEIATFIKKGKI